jgi:hypothetical protein
MISVSMSTAIAPFDFEKASRSEADSITRSALMSLPT